MANAKDPFEADLLSELRAKAESGELAAPQPNRKRRWAVVGGAALAGGAVLTFSALSVNPALPAFAIDEADGVTKVTITSAEGAEGAEAALADLGVKADITVLPEGKVCAQGRYAPSQTNEDYYPDQDVMLLYEGDSMVIAFSDEWKAKGETFVLEASMDGSGSLDVTKNPVGECRIIDKPVYPEDDLTDVTNDPNCESTEKTYTDMFGEERTTTTTTCS